MATRRTVLARGARIATGLATLAVAAAVLVGVQLVPLPNSGITPAAVSVTPTPTAQTRVCAGSLVKVATDQKARMPASGFGAATVSPHVSSGTETLKPLARPNIGGSASTPAQTVTVPAAPDGEPAPLLAAAQSQTAGAEDLTGLAAASCIEASADSWLVAGATDLGSTSVLLLTNPTDVEAIVSVTIFGGSGRIDAPGATGISVKPSSQRAILLAGLAPDLASPVVHVTATGGRVAASIQQSIVRGITPGGVELASPAASPARSAIIPGVRVAAPSGAGPGGVDAVSRNQPVVRILAPTKDTTVRVGATGESGTTGGDSAEVKVKKGSVVEVPLADLGVGVYDITLEAKAPIVASARTSVSSAAGADFAWYQTAVPLTGDVLVAVAQGPNPRVHVVNPTTKPLTFFWSNSTGPLQRITLDPGTGRQLEAMGGGVVRLNGARGAVASVDLSGDGVSSAYVVAPRGPLASAITVHPR